MTMELIGQVLDEKYHIEQPLGQGGMGTVFLATHVGTKRPVALKIIRPQFMAYSEFVERFKREAEAAGRLRNPNVVNVTDFGFTNVNGSRIGYLVMEYLDGCSLADVLNEEARLPLNFVVEVLEQVSSAIEEAHQQGIIHRDLKPDNIWLEPTGRGDYLVKVLDFGLAKLADDAQSSQINPTNHAHTLNAKEISVITVAQPDSNISGNNISSNNISAEFSEAETNFQLSTQSTESITQAQPFMNSGKVVDNHEIVTQAQPAYPIAIAQNDAQNDVNSDVKDEEAATQIQPAEGLTARTSSKNTSPALTRVGAILGTPIYMSPEQCAGRPLDSRTDIYSLGVIAYEMLAGQPPFKGNIESLIAQHKSAIPTPIRKIRPSIPRKVAELVMSMLAKDPDQRPESAAAFASALRARSEGPITLLRQAISVYIQNFRSFLQLSILTHLPSFLFILIAALFGLFSDGTFNMTSEEPHTNAQIIFLVVLVFGMVTIHSIAYTLALVAFVPVTVQTILLPLRRTQLKPVFLMLKRRLKDIVTTFVHCWVRIFLWSGLAFIPGIIASINYFLIYPVLVVEDLKNKAALERSRLLVQRARLMVIGTWAIQMAISIYSSLLASGLQTKGPVVKMGAKTISTTTQTLIGFFLGSLSNLFFFPLLAILLVLLYLNTRKSGGETLKEVLGQYMEAELPTTKWQQRMEEKLRLRTRIQSTHISAHNTPANRSNPSEKNL